ncbi:MAG TPA: hypothetical protein DIV86_04610 [Alphaproteobacteria bacterium]|nr:hypothetical protein [Alphaproteobacteria bacterium]
MRFLIIILTLILVTVCGYLINQQYQNTHAPDVGERKIIQNFGNYIAASVAQKSGDYEGAIANLEQAIVKDQDNVEIIEKLYALYLFQGDYQKAIEQARRHIEINKVKNVRAADLKPVPYLITALSEFKEGDIRKVPEILNTLIDDKNDSKNHLDGVVLPLILAWGHAVNEDYQKAFKVIDGITADYMLAVFSYNRAVINDVANNKKVQIKGNKKPSTKEIALFYIAETFSEIGQFSLQSGQLEEATIYVRIAKYISQDYRYTKLLGTILETQNKFEEAIKLYGQVKENEEGYRDSQLSMAIALSRLKRNDEALKILAEVSKKKSLQYMADYTSGTILLADNKFEAAIKSFLKAEKSIKKLSRDNWALYFNLGVAYDKLGNWQKSEENLMKAVQIFPENPESLNYLAYSWLVRNKNIPQSRKMLEAAVIRSGGAAHILDSYGWALYKMGFYKQSLPFLEQAANSIPYNSVINDHLGDLYWKLGRKREARFLWQRAIDNFEDENSNELSINYLKKKIEQGL